MLAPASELRAQVLYDGDLATRPSAQGWLYLTDPIFGASAVQALAGGAVVLDSTPVRSDMAGYFASFPPLGHVHPALPELDRAAGFRIRLDLRLGLEEHVSTDRAGFSVIVLDRDARGLELGFWEDEIWAQSDAPLFTHAEGGAFDTLAGRERYDLCLQGTEYTLNVGGARVLEGPLRDYSAFGPPYDFPSFIFVGDDTGSASALLELARVEVESGLPVVAIGDTLRVRREDRAVVLSAAASGETMQYLLYRDLAAQDAGLTFRSNAPASPLWDLDAAWDGASYYYRITALDACGLEHE